MRLLLLFTLPILISGFAAPKQGGWTTRRRAVPELQESSGESTSSERQPWEPLRFVQQSSKFVSMNPFANKKERVVQPGDVLWTPSSSENAFQFAPLDDVVMGGVSSSTFDSDTGLWKGSVTDANSGGFIGIRSTPAFAWNMEQCTGIQVKLKTTSPNTQRYKFITRDSTDFNGVSWTTSIDVKGTDGPMKLFTSPEKSGVTTIKIPFDKQVPTIFAKTVPDQTFQKDNIVGLQLTYSKFEYDGDLNPNFSLGDMELQILEITAYGKVERKSQCNTYYT